jgi:acyl carrier protein
MKPGLTAKRIVKVIGERLRRVDPGRWETVPITFKTHFRDENGYADIATAIHIHDALEREFGIDIKDRQILVTDVETAFYVVMQHHEAH